MKQCSTCKQLKPESEFSKDKSKADGLMSQCKECAKQYNKQWCTANREKVREYKKQYRKANREKELERQKRYREANHEQIRERMKQWRSANREQISEYKKQYNKQWREANPEQYLWKSAKDRAKKRGLEFNIELSDIVIPEFCPVLGLKLERGTGGMQDNSPSLDRIDSSKGYIKGNVRVISYRANTIKNCGTAEEHRLIAEFIERNSK